MYLYRGHRFTVDKTSGFTATITKDGANVYTTMVYHCLQFAVIVAMEWIDTNQ